MNWEDLSYGFQPFATSPKFKGLKSLDFCAELLDENEVEVCQMILLHGFKLPQLSLVDLKLTFDKSNEPDTAFRVVDHNLLIALNSGPVAKSLLNVDIDPRYAVEDAHQLLEILKSTAAENRMKRVEIHGKERERKFNR